MIRRIPGGIDPSQRLTPLCLPATCPLAVEATIQQCPARFADAGTCVGAQRNLRADQRNGRAARNGADAERCSSGGRDAQLGSSLGGSFTPRAIRNSSGCIPAHSAAEPRALSEKYFAARPEYMPVLRASISKFGADVRPRGTAFARRALDLGEFGGVLLSLQ